MPKKKSMSPYVTPGLKQDRRRSVVETMQSSIDQLQLGVAEYARMVKMLDYLCDIVADHFVISVEELKGSRIYEHTRPRQMVIWLVRQADDKVSWRWLSDYFPVYTDRSASKAAFDSMDKRIRDKEEECDSADVLLPMMRKWISAQ